MLAASADLPGPARLMGLVVAGHAALACGRLTDALPLLREAWAGLADSKHEFRFRCRTLLATSLAQSGKAESAGPLLSDIRAGPHPAYLFLAPDDLLARAWGAAAEGATSEALDHAVAAVEVARGMGAPAYEVLAWQTVVQLGEAASALPRLTSLAALTPRARVAAAHARALADSDAERLLEAAESWSRLGDLVAAGDAAAQAADAHRRRGRPGSALGAAALAQGLAARSGARTPALAIAVRPLPLTAPGARDREARRPRALEQGHRRAADGLGAHRRGSPLSSRTQARRLGAQRPGARSSESSSALLASRLVCRRRVCHTGTQAQEEP